MICSVQHVVIVVRPSVELNLPMPASKPYIELPNFVGHFTRKPRRLLSSSVCMLMLQCFNKCKITRSAVSSPWKPVLSGPVCMDALRRSCTSGAFDGARWDTGPTGCLRATVPPCPDALRLGLTKTLSPDCRHYFHFLNLKREKVILSNGFIIHGR